jgi:hypothetical protein
MHGIRKTVASRAPGRQAPRAAPYHAPGARLALAGATFLVLRDPRGVIVATRDEGRWWTLDEFDAFTALAAALTNDV